MTDQDKELRMRISMLMDSDLDGRDNPRLIDGIKSDPALKATWARYSLIGDVMRSSGPVVLADQGFAARVSAVISEEPTVFAPKALKPAVNMRSSIVTFGLAASLAMVAILVGKSVNDQVDIFQTAANSQTGAGQAVAKSSDQADNLAESQFNDYLVMHNETAYMAGSASMLPYVRVIGSGPGR
jgi:sigma-E factor negative regulatory protein RseA